MERLPYRLMQAAIAAALVLLAGGCREGREDPPPGPTPPGSGRPEPPAPAAAAPGPVDELIRLFPLKVERPDRVADENPAAERATPLRLPQPVDGPSAVERAAMDLHPGEEWVGEQLGHEAAERLARLARPPVSVDFSRLAATAFQCRPLRLAGLKPVFRSGRVTVYRPPLGASESQPAAPFFQGPGGLEAALVDLREGFGPDGFEMAFKVTGVVLPRSGDEGTPPSEFMTGVRVEMGGSLAGSGSPGRRQILAEWVCSWVRPAGGPEDPPLLTSIETGRYEEAHLGPGSGGAPTLFVDATAEALGATPHFRSQTLHGTEYWAKRLTRPGDFFLAGHQGLALGDVDGDGLEDLYVCDGGSLPNRLYLQNADGTVRDFSSASQVDFLEDSRGALLVDLDNDGDQDLVVATVAIIVFAENDGAGVFTLRGGHMGAPYATSLSAADYDNDGDLDLYACVYEGDGDAPGTRGFDGRTPVPFNDAENGGRNRLLENLGAFRFADVTDRVGLGMNNSRWSFAAAWEDYDQDGDADLYVANDFGRNCLYRNDAGAGADGRPRFVDIAPAAGVEDASAGMSVAWGDYNRDGWMDLYVGNMFSAAGRRVRYQRTFRAGKSLSELGRFERMARGNTLFSANRGGAGFSDRSEVAGVTMGRWAWSSAFADLNNDGWEDVVVANGFMTATRDDDL